MTGWPKRIAAFRRQLASEPAGRYRDELLELLTIARTRYASERAQTQNT